MHQLTIAADTGATTTHHDDYDDANRALLIHVKRSDTYLRSIAAPTNGRAAFELLRLSHTGTQPTVTGAAFIEPISTTDATHTTTPYYAAAAALHWISDQQPTPRAAPPAAAPEGTHPALSAARAALHSTLQANPLWNEAATLADLTATPAPSPHTFNRLRHLVAALGFRPASPAALAAAVQRQTDANITPQQVAVLIWWTALLTWALAA